MNTAALFALLGGLLVLAFAANRLFDRTRVPDVVVLMVAGVLLGPVIGLIDAGELRGITQAFGTLAIILILFEGGLELNLRDTIRHSPGGMLFAVLVYTLSLGAISLVAWWVLALTVSQALLVGAVLGCTSIAIVMPVLQQMQVREPVKVTFLLEASLGEVFAVLTVGIILEQTEQPAAAVQGVVGEFLSEIAVALVLAAVTGVVWARLMPRMSKQPFWQVLTFSVVLLLYATTEAVDASGLIAVFGFGLTLANFSKIGPRMVEATFGLEAPAEQPHLQILAFHSELAFLVRTFFFVLLGVVVDLGGMLSYLLPALAIFAALVLARWLAVPASQWSWRDIGPQETSLIFLVLPRGLITAVLAIQVFVARGESFAFLPSLAFAIILATSFVVVYAGMHHQAAAAAPAAPASNARSGGQAKA
ncbi:MAG: cation:proton antiporter [Terriglobia bacterium]